MLSTTVLNMRLTVSWSQTKKKTGNALNEAGLLQALVGFIRVPSIAEAISS